MSAETRRKSPIWEYFEVTEDARFARCKACKMKISRGGQTTKTFNTTNLQHHLRTRHQDRSAAYERAIEEEKVKANDRKQTKASACFLQQSLLDVRKWDINNSRAQRVHQLIAEMIALDSQPLSIVNYVGFTRLLRELEPRYSLPSRRYITETVLPKVYEEVRSGVRKQVDGVSFFSFTTDGWTSDDGIANFLSLTAHWLTDDFERKSAILHVLPLEEAHTGEYLCHTFLQMLDGWNIKKNQVHLVLRDNAANMVKGMREACVPSYGCFAHTLQLVIGDGLLFQKVVKDLFAVCHRIVSHLKHSSLAHSRLQKIQASLGLPQHRLPQDVSTTWNSSLYMLQAIIEQKMAIAAYSSEYRIPQLTATQLEIAAKVIEVLEPFEEITKAVSSNASTISLVIPFVRMLHRTLKEQHNDKGIQSMKDEILKSLQKRFSDITDNYSLVLATLLDPRFKDKFFSDTSERSFARGLLQEKCHELLLETKSDPDSCAEDTCPPSPKRPQSLLWRSFSDILKETGSCSASSKTPSNIDHYLSEPVIDFHQASCDSWWMENNRRFPLLSELAQRYLSAPATSVPSERVFSDAGNICNDKRNRLAPERTETLLFIKKNFDICKK